MSEELKSAVDPMNGEDPIQGQEPRVNMPKPRRRENNASEEDSRSFNSRQGSQGEMSGSETSPIVD